MIRMLKFFIDSLFMLLCLGIVGFFLILPFGVFTTKVANVRFQGLEGYWSLPFLYWIGIGFSIATYILFLIGINYLRKTANRFISDSFYSTKTSKDLRLSGIFLVLSAFLLAVTYSMFWLMNVSSGSIKFILGTDIMIPLFLSIVGFFFILQSKVLDQARLFKEDSNLTI